MSYKLEQSIVPLPGTDTTVACDFEIGESSSKLPAFFPRKTKCTPAAETWTGLFEYQHSDSYIEE